MADGRLVSVIGFDPSFSNWGWAKAKYDIETSEFDVTDLGLIQTKSESKKGVIKTSDDLRRARELYQEVVETAKGHAFIFTEIPLGNAAMYNNAILGSGIVTGILAALPPIIQVFPQESKMLAVGARNADKSEIIEWATGKFPNAPWRYRTMKGKQYLKNDNEHLADAVAAINAGIQTEQFKQAINLYKNMLE